MSAQYDVAATRPTAAKSSVRHGRIWDGKLEGNG
jgi:hypothetical protein